MKTIRLNERELHRLISESVKRMLNESQESLYQQFCNLEQDLKTVIANTDSSSNQAFGSPDEKLKMITNAFSHIDNQLSEKSSATFQKLIEVISELQDIRIALKTLNSDDKYWGHKYKTTNGTVGLSNYR